MKFSFAAAHTHTFEPKGLITIAMIVRTEVKIGLMWASEQTYGEVLRAAQAQGVLLDNKLENLKTLKALVRRRRRKIKRDPALHPAIFVNVEDIKLPLPYADSPCAGLTTHARDRGLYDGYLRGSKDQFLGKFGSFQ